MTEKVDGVVSALSVFGERTASELAVFLKWGKVELQSEIDRLVRMGSVQLCRDGSGNLRRRGRLGFLYELTVRERDDRHC